MAEKKKECCKLCKWWVETVDGMGFCKYYSFLCPATDEACNSIFLEEKENGNYLDLKIGLKSTWIRDKSLSLMRQGKR